VRGLFKNLILFFAWKNAPKLYRNKKAFVFTADFWQGGSGIFGRKWIFEKKTASGLDMSLLFLRF
jgi:hypothetical protein